MHSRSGRRKEREGSCKDDAKFENILTVVPLLFSSLYVNMYKYEYGDITKDENEYQDTICSEAEEGNGDRP